MSTFLTLNWGLVLFLVVTTKIRILIFADLEDLSSEWMHLVTCGLMVLFSVDGIMTFINIFFGQDEMV